MKIQSLETMAADYRHVVAVIERLSGKRIPEELYEIVDAFRCTCNPLIVDIGVGKGYKLVLIGKLLEDALPYLLGVDIDPSKVRQCLQLARLFRIEHLVDVVVCDAHRIPLREFTAHIALLWNILMFVRDDETVVKEAYRVLRPHGIVSISTYRVKTGLRNYNPSEIKALIGKYFKIVKVKVHSSNQVKVIGVKHENILDMEINLKHLLTVDQLRRLLEELKGRGFKLASTAGILRINVEPLEPLHIRHARSRITRVVAQHTNTLLFTFIHLSSEPQVLVSKAVRMLWEKSCILTYDDVIKVLTGLVKSKAYAEKLANDLVRLGILTHCSVHSPPSNICYYVPSIRALRVVKLTIPPSDDKRVFTYAALFNPLLRKVLRLIEQSIDINSASLKIEVAKLVRRYWRLCYGFNIDTLEVRTILSEERALLNRLIRPLVSLGVIDLLNIYAT